jgi:hypothetical protein
MIVNKDEEGIEFISKLFYYFKWGCVCDEWAIWDYEYQTYKIDRAEVIDEFLMLLNRPFWFFYRNWFFWHKRWFQCSNPNSQVLWDHLNDKIM